MGLIYRRRIRTSDRTHVNVSGSGLSLSARLSDRVTVNSRGRMTIRLGRGFSIRL